MGCQASCKYLETSNFLRFFFLYLIWTFHNVEGLTRCMASNVRLLRKAFSRVHKCNKIDYNVWLSPAIFLLSLSIHQCWKHTWQQKLLFAIQWHYLTRRETVSWPYFLINSESRHTKKRGPALRGFTKQHWWTKLSMDLPFFPRFLCYAWLSSLLSK